MDVGPLNYKELSTSTDLDSNDLELANTLTTEQALQQQNQIVVNKNAGVGRYSTVFLQGSQSSHILNIKNGFRSSDPSLPSRVFDYGSSMHGLTDSIKVVQGPESIEYGSDALAGVIQMSQVFNYKTHYEVGYLTGSHKTHQLQITKQGPRYEYSVTALKSEGISEVEGSEPDSFEAQQVEAALLLNSNNSIRLSLNHKKSELDDYLLKPEDDPNYYTNDKSYSFNWKNQTKYKNYKALLGVSFEKFERHAVNQQDINSSKTIDEKYSAQSHQVNLKFKEVYDFLNLGLDYYNEVAKLPKLNHEKSHQHFGVWGRSQLEITKRQKFNFGLRHYRIKNSSGVAHQLEYIYDFDSVVVWSRWSSGFKAASISDLYTPGVGNKELKDERNNFSEFGTKYGNRHHSIKFLYFNNKYKDLIQYTVSDGLSNIGRASIEGYELSSTHWFGNYNLKPFINYWSSKNLLTNKRLTLRPEWVVGMGLKRKFTKYDFQILTKYIGDRFDYAENKLDSYIRHDISINYQLNKTVKFYLNILNALNADAKWALGYSSQPREIYLGVNHTF